MAMRPAPLQVSWLGFPGSTGAPYIDYFIGDRIVTPLENAAHFSEKIAQMPGCYQPNDGHRPLPLPSRRSDSGLRDDALVLCAFHQPFKISAEVFDRWCELLHALPGSVLWLLQWNVNVQATLTAAARARGIEPERIVFAPLLMPQEHLSRLALADIYLDAWPCNGHTTVGEALWVGLPVVTVSGPTFAQRVAASLLHAVGVDELVASDVPQYLDTVRTLARDPGRRASLRERLVAARRTSALFDGAVFARDIEALFARMWARAVAGQAPEHLPASDAKAEHSPR
jgi:predicted O-linked N-acetylglucosamine transferase (SPINDLY family)